jgi:hypothetical protein
VIPAGVEILVATAPIDLRWSFDRLAGLAKAEIGREARSGVEAIVQKRGDLIALSAIASGHARGRQDPAGADGVTRSRATRCGEPAWISRRCG